MVSEKRLIDANALMEVMKKEECNCEVFPWAVDNAPTVDAVEVVHGRWIEKQEPIPWCEDDVDVFNVCSVCDCASLGETNYCPNCGAKMDGGADYGL